MRQNKRKKSEGKKEDFFFLMDSYASKCPISKVALDRHKTNTEGVNFQYDRFTTEINKLKITVLSDSKPSTNSCTF
jgi:hypothetical protein